MKAENYVALTSEMRNSTQFKNTLTNYIKSDVVTKRLALLPVEYDTNGLLFTKARLHMMILVNG